MSSTTLSAKKVPCEIRTADEFEGWLSSLRLCPGPIEAMPESWQEALALLPSGYIALASSRSCQLVRCKGEDTEPFSFGKDSMPEGQMVVLVSQAA